MLITLKHKQRCLEVHKEKQRVDEQKKNHRSDDETHAFYHETHNTALIEPDNGHSPHSLATYEIARSALDIHNKQLKALPGIDDKVSLKKQLLPEYLDYLQRYRKEGICHANEVLSTIVIWLFDVDDIEQAMNWAEFAIEQEQNAPDYFNRNLATVVSDMAFDWAQRQYKGEASAYPYFDKVVDALWQNRWPVTQPIVLGKVYKQAALFALREKDDASAMQWFERCVQANPKGHGVKTIMHETKMRLKALDKTQTIPDEKIETQTKAESKTIE